MEFNHFALNICDKNEVSDFYTDILGMELVHSFEIEKSLTSAIFNIEGSFPVFLVKKGNVKIELFLFKSKNQQGFNHICIAVHDKDEVLAGAIEKGYETSVIKREKGDLVFIYDKSGNPFEIKQS